MVGWNASIDLFWVVSYAEKLITLSFCSCDAFLAPFQRWFASAYTFCTLFDNFRTDHPRPLRRWPTAFYPDYPRRSVRLFTAVRAEQPRNSAEKVKFSMSHTVYPTSVNMSPRVWYIAYRPPYRTIYITYSTNSTGICYHCESFCMSRFVYHDHPKTSG